MTSPAEPRAPQQPDGGLTPSAMRLQILTAEHSSLVASRGLAWNEAFARVSMFLSTLSFAAVALALVAQATAFGEDFRLFALAVLPVVLFLGISTHLRVESANYHDVLCIVGMNRIRAEYLRLAPDLAPVFIMGASDDLEGVGRTMAAPPDRSLLLGLISASPIVVAVLNAVLAAVIVALGAVQLNAAIPVALAVGVVGFAAALALYGWSTRRTLVRLMRAHRPLYPSRPTTGGTPGPD